MNNKDSNISNLIPNHIHRGKNYLRIFSLVILIILTILTIISFKFFGLIFLPFLLGELFGICCVRFPRIKIYDDRFIVEKKGLLAKFNDYDSFKFDDLKSIEFSKGFTDWNYLIVLSLFGSGGYGGNNKADQMIVKTADDKIFVFNRFGDQPHFISTIDKIKSRIRPAAKN